MNNPPGITVIVPFYNAASTLESCLDAILASATPDLELLAVDDGSTDHSAEICAQRNVRVLHMEKQSGPAAARNRGAAAARGDLLYFLDADVVMEPDNPAKLIRFFQENPEVTAVFGSYDCSPGASNFLSQYRNLLHHIVHQRAGEEARTFWAGCGVVQREIFLGAGGFDADRYPKPSIEDIEFGLRLHRKGHRIRLEKSLQVKHLKEWRFAAMLRTDIRSRAWPWSLLILERGDEVRDLNVGKTERLSGVLVCLAVAWLLSAVFYPWALPAAVSALFAALILNWEVYRFFAKVRGPVFAARVIPLHFLHYLFSSCTFLVAWMWTHVRSRAPAYDGVHHDG